MILPYGIPGFPDKSGYMSDSDCCIDGRVGVYTLLSFNQW
jgi:hypothetical protein